MSSLLIIILLAVLGYVINSYCIKTARSLWLLAVIIFGLIASGILPYFLLNSLQSPDFLLTKNNLIWRNNNAIIVLGAGNIKIYNNNKNNIIMPGLFGYSRVLTAAELYFSCKKTGQRCTIIASGGDPLHTHISEAEIYKNLLTNLNIPPTDIITESQSKNSYQNAKFSAQIVKKYNYNQIILTTSALHMQRALLYFNHFGIQAQPVATDYLAINIKFSSMLSNMAYNFACTDFALHEEVGILEFYLKN